MEDRKVERQKNVEERKAGGMTATYLDNDDDDDEFDDADEEEEEDLAFGEGTKNMIGAPK